MNFLSLGKLHKLMLSKRWVRDKHHYLQLFDFSFFVPDDIATGCDKEDKKTETGEIISALLLKSFGEQTGYRLYPGDMFYIVGRIEHVVGAHYVWYKVLCMDRVGWIACYSPDDPTNFFKIVPVDNVTLL